jgi:hypothetical protein
LTLDCERWTLTHSSGWAAVLVGLVLVLVLGLGLVLGLAAMRAASEAEAVVWGDDGEADDELDDPEADPDGEPDPDGDPEAEPEGEPDPDGDPEAEPDSEGDAGVRLGPLLGLVVAVVEPEPEGDGVGVGVGEFVGVGLGVGVGVGVGLGEGVLEAGRTWHFVSVFALALAFALGLVEVPGLGEAAASRSVLACAEPARTPRVRKPPPTTLSAATRTCARRIRIALSPLLIRVTVCSSWVRRRLADGWVSILISGVGLSYACPRPPDHGRAALAGRRPNHQM